MSGLLPAGAGLNVADSASNQAVVVLGTHGGNKYRCSNPKCSYDSDDSRVTAVGASLVPVAKMQRVETRLNGHGLTFEVMPCSFL